MTHTRKAELVDLSDQVWQRIDTRFAGLSDAEYLWEPAPGSWTIRQRPDGTWHEDLVMPQPDPEPFTTIAWRLWHLTDMYGENRAPEWLDVAPQGPAIGLDDPDGAPSATAEAALELLRRAHGRWDAHLALVTDDVLGEPVGPVGGQYAEHTKAAYVLHMLDEFIHHGAEIALLRDLWCWQHPVDSDELRERVIRGDRSVVATITNPDGASDLLSLAAVYARWDLVADLAKLGVPVATTGRTPLHLVAIAGELEVVRLLVDSGADLSSKDPEFGATPAEWARFRNQDAVAAWLERAAC